MDDCTKALASGIDGSKRHTVKIETIVSYYRIAKCCLAARIPVYSIYLSDIFL
jgi:hypothetical protein